MTQLVIGIDIGGTNTDAVLVNEERQLLSSVKTPTTTQVEEGVTTAIQQLLAQSCTSFEQIRRVMVGTTHATNAILEGRDLFSVGLIRLAGQRPQSLPPACSWPKSLRERVVVGSRTLDGGFECDGREITPFDESQVIPAVQELIDLGAESLAVVGAFSPLNPAQEQRVAEIIEQHYGRSLAVSLSHQLGGTGFMERENSTLLNAALKKTLAKGFGQLKAQLRGIGLEVPIYLIQNNGSILSIEEALDFPVLTISAGPTNSFMGASKLAGLDDAIVVDVGGTSTDVGLVRNGFCRRSLNGACIGGVPLNFSMPDVLSVAIGGGSYVRDAQNIGPESVGAQLKKQAQSFGGEILTLTDIALAMGQLSIEGASSPELCPREGKRILETCVRQICQLCEQMADPNESIPILLVGGGATCFPISQLPPPFLRVENAAVANAYGAALAEVAASVDTVISLTDRTRAIETVREQAEAMALSRGAPVNELRLVDLRCSPFHYVPGDMGRISLTLAGPFS